MLIYRCVFGDLLVCANFVFGVLLVCANLIFGVFFVIYWCFLVCANFTGVFLCFTGVC